jgi:hypothetical protein
MWLYCARPPTHEGHDEEARALESCVVPVIFFDRGRREVNADGDTCRCVDRAATSRYGMQYRRDAAVGHLLVSLSGVSAGAQLFNEWKEGEDEGEGQDSFRHVLSP